MAIERLSAHLSVPEFIGTNYRSLAEENEREWYGSPLLRAEARRFAETVFEPVRLIVGPLYASSGFRSLALNKAVGGKQKPISHHVLGLAVDAMPLEMSVRDALFAIAQAIRRGELPHLDKAVDEFGGRWLHIQAAEPGDKPLHWVMATANGKVFSMVA